MARIIVFDVNETLLDLAALDEGFGRVFGDVAARQEWFAQVLHTAFAVTAAGGYHQFGEIGAAALEMVAARRALLLEEAERAALLAPMLELPPHPEVPAALDRLQAAGLQLAALTNSAPDAAVSQLENAGIIDRFERVMSVDAARRLKPAPEVYLMAAAELGQGPENLRMVAAHDWDVAGAMKVGYAGAFVARPGMVLNPLHPAPDVVGADLAEVAAGILAVEQAE